MTASVYPTLEGLLAAVRSCRVCEAHLPLGPRPVLSAGATAPWDDPSGDRLRAWMGVQVELTLLIGQHAQRHFLGRRRKRSVAETARAWKEYAPPYMPLPHPSPRNQPWFQRHPWFERELIPVLRARVTALNQNGSK